MQGVAGVYVFVARAPMLSLVASNGLPVRKEADKFCAGYSRRVICTDYGTPAECSTRLPFGSAHPLSSFSTIAGAIIVRQSNTQ